MPLMHITHTALTVLLEIQDLIMDSTALAADTQAQHTVLQDIMATQIIQLHLLVEIMCIADQGISDLVELLLQEVLLEIHLQILLEVRA